VLGVFIRRVDLLVHHRGLWYSLIVLVFYSLAYAQQQSLAPNELPASERLQQRIEKAAVSNTSNTSIFIEPSYPKNQAEFADTQMNGILLVSVFGKNEDATLLKAAYLEAGGTRSALTLNRVIKRNQPETEDVQRGLGSVRTNYFFILPMAAAQIGGTIEIELRKGGKFKQTLAPPVLRFPDTAPSTENGAFLKGLQALALRDFPDFPFYMRVRVSQGVLQGSALRQVAPVFPRDPWNNRVIGEAVMKVVIGRDGRVQEIKPVSGHPAVLESAMAAVRQWVYRPFLLNGEPVEVETQIVVNFNASTTR
jgi:hypothetical protein